MINNMNTDSLIRQTVKRLQSLERQMLSEQQFIKNEVCEFDAVGMSFAIQQIHDITTKYERRLVDSDGVNITMNYGNNQKD